MYQYLKDSSTSSLRPHTLRNCGYVFNDHDIGRRGSVTDIVSMLNFANQVQTIGVQLITLMYEDLNYLCMRP